MAWKWKIRDHVKNGSDTKYSDVYNCIDAMCYLLYPMNYIDFFLSDMKDVLDHFLARLALPDARNLFSDIPWLVGQLTNLKNSIGSGAGMPPANMNFHMLYTAARDGGGVPTDLGIASAHAVFATIKNRPAFKHLCMPFLIRAVSNQDIINFLFGTGGKPGLGSFTLLQLYTSTKKDLGLGLLSIMYNVQLAQLKTTATEMNYPKPEGFFGKEAIEEVTHYVANSIIQAQRAGILINHTQSARLSVEDPKPNDQCCDGVNGCIPANPANNRFCSETLTGACSAKSESCP